MAFKTGDKLGKHEVVDNLLDHPEVPRPNFGYEEFNPAIGDKLGNYVVVSKDTPGAESVWVHIDGSPEGTSNYVTLAKA